MEKINCTYAPGNYNLSVSPTRSNNWHNCRDNFARFFKSSSKILYLSLGQEESIGDQFKELISFVHSVEDKLKLVNKTKFEKCLLTTKARSRTVVKVFIPKFWRRSSSRRSLYTLILKSTSRYKVVEDLFQKSGYQRMCAPSIERFMEGYTLVLGDECSGRFGWVSKFDRLTEKELEKILVKPNIWNFVKTLFPPKRCYLFSWFLGTGIFIASLYLRASI
jgi:hypothetical protein